jgi:hypothetical protein
MRKITLLLLGLALSGAATLCPAEEENSLRQLLERKKQTAPQAPASTPAPAPAATPAPAQRVAAAPEAKDACGKKKHKNHGKGWAKGHDKNC